MALTVKPVTHFTEGDGSEGISFYGFMTRASYSMATIYLEVLGT